VKRQASCNVGNLKNRSKKKLETDHPIDVVPGTLKLLRSRRCARQAPPSVAYIDPAGEITPPIGTSKSVATCAEELAGRAPGPLKTPAGLNWHAHCHRDVDATRMARGRAARGHQESGTDRSGSGMLAASGHGGLSRPGVKGPTGSIAVKGVS
jgi:hypothetical protein